MQALPLISCLLSAAAVVLLIFSRARAGNDPSGTAYKLDALSKKLDDLISRLREDFKQAREENASIAAQNRQELQAVLQAFRIEMTQTLHLITHQNKTGIESLNRTLDERISGLMATVEANNHLMRGTLTNTFRGFQDSFERSVDSFNNLQREKFGQLDERQKDLVLRTEKKLEDIRESVEEKLQKTLQDRLGQSFDMVTKQLASVQQGLGEMQTLAQDVGGLKKVLSNVKMRGGFGEVQLHMLLETILAPEQYEANVATKRGSAERVEFAVKFPNREGDRDFVWLPIDAKFPKDAYENLQAAYDTNDVAAIETAQRSLEAVIKKMAKDICEKYIDAPGTTNFGIMFLPFEGLFAEVVRKASLLEDIQRNCNVVITGPTTLAVILNSLQMGFRTLAIQKRSSEVWQVLGAVKKEFGLFGGLLEKAQNNIQTGLNQLDDVVGVRTRAIQRKLRGVEVLDDAAEITSGEASLKGLPDDVE